MGPGALLGMAAILAACNDPNWVYSVAHQQATRRRSSSLSKTERKQRKARNKAKRAARKRQR